MARVDGSRVVVPTNSAVPSPLAAPYAFAVTPLAHGACDRACPLRTADVNEADHSLNLVAAAVRARDAAAALAAWQFGRDSWNSYLAVINPQIVPKVGEPFELVQASTVRA